MDDESAMRLAISLGQQAGVAGEVPVGCVVLDPLGNPIGQGANRREIDADPSAHAEIVAMRQAAKHLGHWRLPGCTLIVTLEPCPMCAGAMVNARVARLIYGAADAKAGAVRSLYQLCDDPRLNHRLQIVSGVLAEPCAALLRDFFQVQRRLGKK